MLPPALRRGTVDKLNKWYNSPTNSLRAMRSNMSGRAANDSKPETVLVTEESPVDPMTDYERSKADAERYLMGRRGQGITDVPDVVILRPTMIYGPRARFLGAKMAAIPPVMALFFDRLPKLRGGAVFNW